MNNTTLISNALIVLFPFITALAAYLYKIVVGRMPEAQRLALFQFAQDAVQFVEMVYTNALGEQKKTQAMKAIVDMFQEFHLPVPSDSVLNAAIEAAVWSINQQSSQFQSLPGGNTPPLIPSDKPVQEN